MEVWNTAEASDKKLAVSYDYDDYYDDDYDDYDDGYGYDSGYGYSNEGYTNDGTNVNLFGYGSYTIDLSSGYYGTAVNINAAYSAGNNVLIGNYTSNIILAGSGASSLWGGADYANDVLVGGSNADMFYCGRGEGNDAILNASSADLVWLHNVALSDITATAYDGTTFALAFNTGNVLTIACTDYYSPSILTADGGAYRFNRMTASWQQA